MFQLTQGVVGAQVSRSLLECRHAVEYVIEHEWGRGRRVPTVPPERVRPAAR